MRLSEIDNSIHEEAMERWEMVNLSSQHIGLPVLIWVG